MNVLLTSSGRRGYLVQYFKQALRGEGKVYVGNSSPLSSAMYYGDECVMTPLIYDENYIPFLLEYCKKEKIELIIPLFDVDLPVLSKNKEVFQRQGITVIVSDSKVIENCNDKWKTYLFCKNNGFSVPDTYLDIEDVKNDLEKGAIHFPLIIKPRWGMGSIGIEIAENEIELQVLYDIVKKKIFQSYLQYESENHKEFCVVIQQYIEGQEYGLDVIHNLSREYELTVVKKKLAMRFGETDCSCVIKEPVLEELGKQIGKKLQHIGNLDVDVFVKDGKSYVLEMNARFGGGYPFSHMSGVNLPKAILHWMKGECTKEDLQVKFYNRVWQKDICFVDLTENISRMPEESPS